MSNQPSLRRKSQVTINESIDPSNPLIEVLTPIEPPSAVSVYCDPKLLRQSSASAIFPAMSSVDLQALITDIKQHGQRHPVQLLDVEVIDGWHRVLACRHLDIQVQAQQIPKTTDVHALAFSANLHRRNLTIGQRVMVAATRANMQAGFRSDLHPVNASEPPAAILQGDDRDRPVSVAIAAAQCGVSERYVRYAKCVLDANDEQLSRAVREDRLSVKRAAELAELPTEQRASELSVLLNQDADAKERTARSKAKHAIRTGKAVSKFLTEENANQASIELFTTFERTGQQFASSCKYLSESDAIALKERMEGCFAKVRSALRAAARAGKSTDSDDGSSSSTI